MSYLPYPSVLYWLRGYNRQLSKYLNKGGTVNLKFDDLFSKVSTIKTNNYLAQEALDMVFLRVSVVLILREFEATDTEAFWWKNRNLMKIFKDLYEAAVITLPSDPVDRLRWIALLCVECSISQDFDCGNLIIPPDYASNEDLERYEELYGSAIIADIKTIRNELTEKGWKVVFGW